MADSPVADLIHTLDLEPLPPSPTGEDQFRGPSQWMPGGRVFGGQILAQSLTAAMRTVDENRAVHSLHGYFLRPGDASAPITFGVDRIHDGRSYATRRTQAFQNGVPILSLIASFQREESGLDHQIDMPDDLPAPEDVPSAAEALSAYDHPIARYWAEHRPFDMRHVPTPLYFTVEGERVPRQAVWMKATSPLPDDPNLHRAALAYVSDYSILEPTMRRHGIAWSAPGLKFASLDHAMWWHRFGRVDEWMLYLQESPNASGGRGLNTGRIYSREGVLLASVAQEGMMRPPTDRSAG